MAGPSLSLEVLAWGGRAVPLQVTGLEFDAAYDCKRVVAPVGEATWDAPPTARLGPRRARHAGRLRRRRAPRRGSAPQRPDGRRGHGARRRAQGPRDRRAAAEPDAHGGALVERPQHRRRCCSRRWRARRPPVGGPRCPPRLRVPARSRSRGFARGRSASMSWGALARSRWCPASSAATEALTDYVPRAREWSATLIADGTSVAEARRTLDAAVAEAAPSRCLNLYSRERVRRWRG